MLHNFILNGSIFGSGIKKYSEGGGVAKGWTDAEYAKGGKLFGGEFVELEDMDSKKIYARHFGHVETDKKGRIELCVLAEIMNLEDYVPEESLPKEGNFQLSFTLMPYDKYIAKKWKSQANSDNFSMGSNTLVNVYEYMGGLYFEPNDKAIFKTKEDAEKYLHSKELNDKITGMGVMSGFVMDRNYNRAGNTNWERLAYMTGESNEFEQGGGVAKGWTDAEYAKGGGIKQKGKTDKKHDKDYKAKRVGYRYTDEFAKKHGLKPNAKPTQEHIEKYLGNGVYFEDRANRSDKSRMKKLKRGGNAGNKSMMQRIQDEVKRLKAESPNMFKKHTDFVKKAAANLKAKGQL